MSNKNSLSFLPATFITMSLLLSGITCGKAVIFKIKTYRIDDNIQAAIKIAKMDVDLNNKYQERFRAAAEKLKNRSLFSMPSKAPVNPVKKIDAIMGAEALIDNEWYKAGDSIKGVKIISVDSAEVTLLFNGKEIKLSPISAPTRYAVREKPAPMTDMNANKGKPAETTDDLQQQVQSAQQTVVEDEFSWVGVKLSPELKAKFVEQWSKLSDEQKAEAKKRWQAMPDGQKQMYVDQMEMRMKSGQM